MLVTGASGYIGSQLTRQLAEEHGVTALAGINSNIPRADAHNVKWFSGDIRDRRFVESVVDDADVVIHLGGVKGFQVCARETWTAVATNVLATRQLLEVCRQVGVGRFVFASTYWVYGRQAPAELPSSELSELRPTEAYGMTKALAESIVRASGQPHIIVRLSNIFGFSVAGDAREIVFSMVQSAVRWGRIDVAGGGQATVDLLTLRRACCGIQRLFESSADEALTVNLGSGDAVSIRGIAELVAHAVQECVGRKIRVRHISPQMPQIPRAISVARLRELVDLPPAEPLQTAIQRYVQEYAKLNAVARLR